MAFQRQKRLNRLVHSSSIKLVEIENFHENSPLAPLLGTVFWELLRDWKIKNVCVHNPVKHYLVQWTHGLERIERF